MKLFNGIKKNVVVMGVISFLTDLSSEMIYPLLPLFLTGTLNASKSFVGLMEGIAETTASILKLFSGWLSDRLKKRKAIVAFGYSLSSLVRPLVSIATGPFQVLLIRFADRIGKGFRTAPRDALIAGSVEKKYYGKAFGFQRAMDHLGAVFGPLVAFVLITKIHLELRTVFALAAIPGIFTLLMLIFLKEKKQKKPVAAEKDISARMPLSLKPFNKNFKMFLLVITVFTLGNSSDAFLILRAKEAGVPVSFIPLLWAALHIVKTFSALPGGALSDKLGRKPMMIGGWIIYGLVYIGFAFADTPLSIWVLFLIYGIFYGMTEGTERAFIADLVPENLRGTAFGVYNFAIGLMALPSSLLMGYLYDKYGAGCAFSTGATLALFAVILFFPLIKDNSFEKKPDNMTIFK